MDSRRYRDQRSSHRPSRHTQHLQSTDDDTNSHSAAPINPRRKYRRRGTGDSDQKGGLDSTGHVEGEDEEVSSVMSDSSGYEHELDDFVSDSDDNHHQYHHDVLSGNMDRDIEGEVGLSREERRKFLSQKRKQNRLDARIAGVGVGAGAGKSGGAGRKGGISQEEAQQADRDVVRKLVFNGALIGLWYVFSLSISIYNKWMFSSDHLDFRFPLFTTSLHMLVQFILTSCILFIFPSLRPSQPQNAYTPLPSSITPSSSSPMTKPLITPFFYLTRLIPTGTATSLDIGLGNTSLRYITLTFYTMCKSSVLIFVLLFAFLFRLEAISIKLVLIILTMTLGVLMMVFGETAFHALGFALAISASFFSGFRWALTQILLLRHPATSNPFATMFFLAPIMFTTLFVISMASEGPRHIVTGLYVLAGNVGIAKAVGLMFIPGCLAFCMIASEFTLLQRTNVVTLSICGIFKEVVTISAAGIIFHDELSVVNVSGLLVTIASIAAYNYMKVTKMRSEARAKLLKKTDDENGDNGVDAGLGGVGGADGQRQRQRLGSGQSKRDGKQNRQRRRRRGSAVSFGEGGEEGEGETQKEREGGRNGNGNGKGKGNRKSAGGRERGKGESRIADEERQGLMLVHDEDGRE